MYVCLCDLPTNCGDGHPGGASDQASSGTVWSERENCDDLEMLSLFQIKIEKGTGRLPGLFQRTPILMDNLSLLWVDDGGRSHDNSSTFTWY